MGNNTEPKKNGWYEWKNHVLLELQRMNKNIEHLEERMNLVQTSITTLKIKASLWGAAAGSLPVILVVLLKVLKVV